ncbi:MAG: non-canonical purine NTP pyrophosphatase [Planctomycetaceae bacterium]|nr:non-canonical purine NTP pyrophosphatase [Planctomycetaceae bacterium]
MFTLILGTNNRKKGIELAELLAPHNVGQHTIKVQTLADFEQQLDVIEDGLTFADNARKKAVEQAKFLNSWVVGEDSGLCVDALDGAPGVYSARFAASSDGNASDEDNNRLLLEKLRDVPLEKRTAYYVCVAVLSDPAGNVQGEAKAICRGRILFEHSGQGGFGYDPLFEVVEYHQTFGTLPPALKRAISHRARAVRKLIPTILERIQD